MSIGSCGTRSVGIASDSSVLTMGEGAPHPRGYGNNARVLGEYVRARKVITLEEAVRKMTSLPAEQFQFADRGLIAAGYAAESGGLRPRDGRRRGDVREAARLRAPASRTCWSTACLVIGNGEHTGAKPGQALMLPRPQSPKR